MRPTNDIQKRQGWPGGWFADWLSENFGDYQVEADETDQSDWTDFVNANKEFVQVSFPCRMEVESIRLQGIKKIETGGTSDLIPNPPIDATKTLYGCVQEVEVWCNDGVTWYSVDENNEWDELESLITDHDESHNNIDQYEHIKKFTSDKCYADDEGLHDPENSDVDSLLDLNGIWKFDLPTYEKGFLECRVVMNKYLGTALGTKLGMIVKDKGNSVCNKRCW